MLEVFWNHHCGLQQQLIAKTTKNLHLTRLTDLQWLMSNFRWDYAFQAPILSPEAAMGTLLSCQHSHCGAKQMKWIPGSGSGCLILCHEQPWEASEGWESPAITMWIPMRPWYSQVDSWALTSPAHSEDLYPPWHSQACSFFQSWALFPCISCTQFQSTQFMPQAQAILNSFQGSWSQFPGRHRMKRLGWKGF